MFTYSSVTTNLLLLPLSRLLFDDDDLSEGGTSEVDAHVREFEELHLNTTLLLPRVVLLIKFSLEGESITRDNRVPNFPHWCFWPTFLLSLGVYLNNTFDRVNWV